MAQIETRMDDKYITIEHASIIQKKLFLRKIYEEFYQWFLHETTKIDATGLLLELGSGGTFIKEFLPLTVTSDLISIPGIDLTCSALALPFSSQSTKAIYMINVFHHVPDSRVILKEIQRILVPGGKVFMVEPANTLFSRIIYRHLHHEPFEPNSTEWGFKPGGRLSSANGALPWIVFKRDLSTFQRIFPNLKLLTYQDFLPLRYLLSGGLSHSQLVPLSSFNLLRKTEDILSPLSSFIGMFTKIVLLKSPTDR